MATVDLNHAYGTATGTVEGGYQYEKFGTASNTIDNDFDTTYRGRMWDIAQNSWIRITVIVEYDFVIPSITSYRLLHRDVARQNAERDIYLYSWEGSSWVEKHHRWKQIGYDDGEIDEEYAVTCNNVTKVKSVIYDVALPAPASEVEIQWRKFICYGVLGGGYSFTM